MSDQLPAHPLADFAKTANQHRRPQSRVEGGFLSFNGKTGEWLLGQEETEVNGEFAVVNSASMQHGYIRWGTTPPAKAFSAVNQPYPEKPEPAEGLDYNNNPKTFHGEEARQFSGRFNDKDLAQFMFNTSSMGGVENVDKLFDEIIRKAGDGTAYCFPEISLTSEWYKRSPGKVYKPVFKIVHWCDMNGNRESAKKAKLDAPQREPAAPDEDEDEDAKPTRRRRRVVND